ncbi:hypothetical protein HY450_00455, partial [Candidatus Pacearchaeota archaeon]|nr:hypothetical protein [Candidatus Pacearchaeota archaeon]
NLFCFAQVLGAVKNATVSILEVFERTKNNGEIFWSLVIITRVVASRRDDRDFFNRAGH